MGSAPKFQQKGKTNLPEVLLTRPLGWGKLEHSFSLSWADETELYISTVGAIKTLVSVPQAVLLFFCVRNNICTLHTWIFKLPSLLWSSWNQSVSQVGYKHWPFLMWLLMLGQHGKELIFILKAVCTFSAGKGRYCAMWSHSHPEKSYLWFALAKWGLENYLNAT